MTFYSLINTLAITLSFYQHIIFDGQVMARKDKLSLSHRKFHGYYTQVKNGQNTFSFHQGDSVMLTFPLPKKCMNVMNKCRFYLN